MTSPTDIARSLSEAQREFGEKVEFHCPYDEATLRVALKHPGYLARSQNARRLVNRIRYLLEPPR